MAFPALVPQPLGDQVAHKLRVRIIGGRLGRGTRLVEDFTRADLEFHSELYRLSGHGRPRAVWEQYGPTFSVLLDVVNAIDAELVGRAAAHAELLRITRTGDEAPAPANLRGARERLRAAVPALPG